MDITSPTVLQFSFFIIFALLGTILSIKLRQPYVVGLLIFGMLAGPNMLGFVDDHELIMTFSELGAILLLFAVGIEFSVFRIIKSGFRAVLITLFKMGLLFFFGYEIALYFGFDLTVALFIGAMIAITSTAVLFKVVWGKGFGKHKTLPLLISMLIVEDLVAVGAITFFSSLEGTAEYGDKFQSILISLGLIGAFYMLVRKPVADAIYKLTSTLNQEITIFVSFSLCLIMSMITALFGLSPVIGAFLAGSIVSSLPNSRSIERTIKPLLLMFAAFFFLSLGMRVDPSAVLANLPLSLTLVAAFLLVCFFSVLILLYLTGSAGKNAVFGASSMVVLGEFSLIIASIYVGEYSSLLIAVGSFGVVATAIVSSLLLGRQESLYEFGQKKVPARLKVAANSLSLYLTGIVRDFSQSGSFWKVSISCCRNIRPKIGRIAIIAIILVVLRILAGSIGLSAELEAQLKASTLVLGLLLIAYFAIEIFIGIRPVIDKLSSSIARHKRNASSKSIILRDLAIAALFILMSEIVPETVSYFRLPFPFGFLDEVLFLVALIFLWDIIRHAFKLQRKRRVR